MFFSAWFSGETRCANTPQQTDRSSATFATSGFAWLRPDTSAVTPPEFVSIRVHSWLHPPSSGQRGQENRLLFSAWFFAEIFHTNTPEQTNRSSATFATSAVPPSESVLIHVHPWLHPPSSGQRGQENRLLLIAWFFAETFHTNTPEQTNRSSATFATSAVPPSASVLIRVHPWLHPPSSGRRAADRGVNPITPPPAGAGCPARSGWHPELPSAPRWR